LNEYFELNSNPNSQTLFSAIERITAFDVSPFPSKVAAMVKRGTEEGEFNPEKWIGQEV
jgi:hypothetical protein